jgi:hypothetical protein
METAAKFLAESLEHYRKLTDLTKDTYRYANSMQTSQRRIPVPGGADGKPANYHWTQLLPMYEKELADFNQRVAELKSGKVEVSSDTDIKPLPKASIKILSGDAETYEVKVGATVFTDRKYKIENLAPELTGLTGIRFAHDTLKAGKYTPIEFETTEPVKILIGYFQNTRDIWLQVPDLEIDAKAIEHIDVEPLIQNAATIEELPALNIHAMKFDAGKNTLDVRGRGSFVILGVIPQSAQVTKRDAKLAGSG